jgi:hypothetical protein
VSVARIRVLAVVAIAIGLLGTDAAVATGSPDQDAANRALIRLSDLPPGWRTAKVETQNSTSKCFNPSQVATPSGKARREFAKGTVAVVSYMVGVYRTTTEAKKVFAALASDKNWNCLVGEMKKETDAKKIEQGRFLLRAIGSPAVGRELVATFESNGITVSAYMHVDVARAGRGVVLLYHGDAFSPALSSREESSVLRRSVSRLMQSTAT